MNVADALTTQNTTNNTEGGTQRFIPLYRFSWIDNEGKLCDREIRSFAHITEIRARADKMASPSRLINFYPDGHVPYNPKKGAKHVRRGH